MANLTDQLHVLLRAAGAARSSDLQDATGAGQSSVSRALAPLLKSGEVLRVGRARHQAYVVPRAVPGIASPTIPVMAVDSNGGVRSFGTLIPSTSGRFWMDEDDGPAQLHGGLPWFISDMRPQGFLGRSFALVNGSLGLAANTAYWTDDDVLRALCHAGDDLPGNLIIGSASFERYMHAPAHDKVSPRSYSRLADAAMQGALPGSSAGGEQPKFCAVRDDGCHIIVKFSAPGESRVDQRWADLLTCEHHALETLRAVGVAAARSRIFRARNRTMLEVERFDRTKRGRIGMVSLLSYDSEFIGQIDNWAAAAGRMQSRGLISDADAQTLRFLEAFGQLIANTDRHYGNVSLLMHECAWRVAPAYDMLPMMYAPIGGELVSRKFDPGALAPSTDTISVWPEARRAAKLFWESVSKDSRVSSAFRAFAVTHAKQCSTEGHVRRAEM